MKKYIWTGPVTHETLPAIADGEPMDLALVTNRPVEVPEDHPLVVHWLAARLLVEPPPEAPAKSKSTRSGAEGLAPAQNDKE